MTLPPEQYRHLERHVPGPRKRPSRRRSMRENAAYRAAFGPPDRLAFPRLTWLLLLVLGVCVVWVVWR